MKLAILLSRFPKATETFIAREMGALSREGFDLMVMPLRARPGRALDDSAHVLEGRVLRRGLAHPAVWAANLYFLLNRPRRYLQAFFGIPRYHRGRSRDAMNFISRFFKAAYFARVCLKRKIGHVHAHWATNPATSAYVMHRLTGLSYSFTAHAYDIWVHQVFLPEKMKAARFILTCTEANAAFLRSLAPEARVIRQYHGLDISRYPLRKNPGEDWCVFSAARFTSKKGLMILLEACAVLRREGHPVRCRFAGGGPLMPALRERSLRDDLRGAVTFLGMLPHEKVIAELREASMTALPCVQAESGDRDGIPNVLVESLAVGTPVVSTPVSGVPELVEHGTSGLLAAPGDAAALAGAIKTLALDPERRRRMGLAGRAKVERDFDVRRSAAALRELFVSAGGSGPS
jgi:glycosyltransferase involved in cell wall biosynthesis